MISLVQKLDKVRHYMIENDLLEILLHLSSFFGRQIFEEFTDWDFDALLGSVDHVVGQMSKEDIIVLLLIVWAEEISNGRSVDVVQENQKVVENLNS